MSVSVPQCSEGNDSPVRGIKGSVGKRISPTGERSLYMLFETPEDTYNAYRKFLKKADYRKAYRCLEKLLNELPHDVDLLEQIVDLCVFQWNNPDMGRQWVGRLLKIRGSWFDYLMLSRIEAQLDNIGRAKEYLKYNGPRKSDSMLSYS